LAAAPGVRAPVLDEQEAGYAPALSSLLSRQNFLPLPGVKPQFHVHPAHSIVYEMSCPASSFRFIEEDKL
jgi:hypothetical protein